MRCLNCGVDFHFDETHQTGVWGGSCPHCGVSFTPSDIVLMSRVEATPPPKKDPKTAVQLKFDFTGEGFRKEVARQLGLGEWPERPKT